MSQRQFKRLLALLNAREYPRNPTYHDLRADLRDLERYFPIPPDVRVRELKLAGVPALELLAPGAVEPRVLFYLHGGAYVAGSPRTHGELAARLGRALRMRVVSLDYRLAPEHPFPAAIEDACAAYRALLAGGLLPEHIAIAGDSAGGGLAVATLLKLRDSGDALPAAALLLSPWIDLEGTGESTRRIMNDGIVDTSSIPLGRSLYLNGHDPRDPLAAPLYADLTGLPPLLIQVGEAEALLDDSRRLAAHAHRDSVDVTLKVFPRMLHVFQIFAPVLDEGVDAITQAGDWLRTRIPPPTGDAGFRPGAVATMRARLHIGRYRLFPLLSWLSRTL